MKKKVRFCIICAMTVSLFGTVQVPEAGKAKEGQEEQRQQDDSESKASYLSQFDAGSYVELADYSSIPVEANEGDTSGIENDIGDYLLKNSTFVKELPTPFVNRNTSTLKDQLQNYADTYEEYIQKLGADYSKKLVAMQAIADAEDLAVTDEELKEQIKTQAEAAGFSDVDEYKSAAKMDPEELREVMMSTKVFEFLEGKVTFNKK